MCCTYQIHLLATAIGVSVVADLEAFGDLAVILYACTK